jgi:hypothetical protein
MVKIKRGLMRVKIRREILNLRKMKMESIEKKIKTKILKIKKKQKKGQK